MSATGLMLSAQAMRFTGAVENGLELALGDASDRYLPSTSDSTGITPVDDAVSQVRPEREGAAPSQPEIHPADPDHPALDMDNQPNSPYDSSLGEYKRDPTHRLWKGTIWWHVDNYSREIGIRDQLSEADMHKAVERALVNLTVGGDDATIAERWEAARKLDGNFDVRLNSSVFDGLAENPPPSTNPGAESEAPPPVAQPPEQATPPSTETCAPFHPDTSWPPSLPDRLQCIPYEAETFMDTNWWKVFALAGVLGVAYGGQRALDRSYAPPSPPDATETEEELAEDDEDTPRKIRQPWWRRRSVGFRR